MRRPGAAASESDRTRASPGISFFVVKRGQRGRFRFTMRNGAGSVRGEVFVEPDQKDGGLRTAYELVEQLAYSLAEKAAASKTGSTNN